MSFYEYKKTKLMNILASDYAASTTDMNCESPQFQSQMMPHFGITPESKKKPWEKLEENLNGCKMLTIYEILWSAKEEIHTFKHLCQK